MLLLQRPKPLLGGRSKGEFLPPFFREEGPAMSLVLLKDDRDVHLRHLLDFHVGVFNGDQGGSVG